VPVHGVKEKDNRGRGEEGAEEQRSRKDKRARLGEKRMLRGCGSRVCNPQKRPILLVFLSNLIDVEL
jgi:hypothetical protein